VASFKNFDTLASYKKLTKLAKNPVSLKKSISLQRIASYCSVYALGDSGETLSYNYAAKAVDDEILSELQAVADEADVLEKYKMLINGEVMNTGEKRLVLHHLARGQLDRPIIKDNKDLGSFYLEQTKRISAFADEVHSGKILASTGKRFDTVVQVGIGGSDLGPRALYLALKTLIGAQSGLKMQAEFISNVDPDDAAAVLKSLNPESTLFILVSKSGTTQETLTNEALVLNYLSSKGITNPRKHMICVTSETSPLAKSSEYLASFFIDDYIGGRYSATSAVGGAVLSLAFGPDVFKEILQGAHLADKAALEKDILKNPALLDALIGVWERNFMNFPSTAILPYSQALSRFPAHLQQLQRPCYFRRTRH